MRRGGYAIEELRAACPDVDVEAGFLPGRKWRVRGMKPGTVEVLVQTEGPHATEVHRKFVDAYNRARTSGIIHPREPKA